MSDAWVIGWTIGAAVVLLVVLLLGILIASARRIARQAAQIRRSLEDVEANTECLWRIADVNVSVRSVAARLAEAHRRPISGKAREDRW